MNICVLMQEIQTLGGVQRVVTSLLNVLVQNTKHNIFLVSPSSRVYKELYHVSSSISRTNAYDFMSKRNPIYLGLQLLKRHKVFLDNIGVNEKILYSHQNLKKYCKYMRYNKINCIIGVDPYDAILGAKISEITGIECIAWMHSTFSGYFLEVNRYMYGYSSLFHKYTCYFKKILVLTDIDKKTYGQYLSEMPSENIVVLNNPITIKPGRSYLNKNVILYVGRIIFDVKGCDKLIDIMKLLVRILPNIIMKIVGDGPDKTKLETMISNNNLADNIFLYDTTSNIESFYEEAGVLLSTSRFEGFGLVIAEAMSYGIPVIAFDTNGARSIITDSIDGYIVNQGDTEAVVTNILNLYRNESLLKEMSNNAYLRAKTFCIDVLEKQFLKYIEM